MPTDTKSLAARFKEEGNALFVAKKYQAARAKYSEAIKADENSAVLYADRAACSQFLKKYKDAASDAKRATEIDAGYAKGWARLAAAEAHLPGNEQNCVGSWQRAINAMPVENLTPAEAKQKEQYKADWELARTRLREIKISAGQAPWYRALALEEDFRSKGVQGYQSSVWVIGGAWKDWDDGVTKMKALKMVPLGPDVGAAIIGIPGALDNLATALLRDDRISHLAAEGNFLELYSKQVLFEEQQVNAWSSDVPVEQIKAEAVERQLTQGWEATRLAITTTIHSLIVLGFMEPFISGDRDLGLEYIGRALQLVRWGMEEWKDVPQEDKGFIFVGHTARAINSLYIDSYMKACIRESYKHSIEKLYKEAQGLLTELVNAEQVPFSSADPGFILSLSSILLGRTLSVLGYYHVQHATRLRLQGSDDIEALKTHWKKAADAYLEAANGYPQDDEMYLWFLNCAAQNYFLCGTPLRVTLPILEKVRLALPHAMKVWQNSALTKKSGNTAYQACRETEAGLRGCVSSAAGVVA
ncbi:hypothetical protein EUX98_g5762 [Antrodiella citrinella]|uniref:Uncharacterized protein n=1 Tax=Antrodiella citrinella TaxID=2447956 RepID=A0A4S4MTE1_9APHY|nr:hypothetical protein EUX98_g5762 [Antrodiella citrinella]